MAKALTVGAMNAVTSFNVNYMITGSVAVSGAVTFIEPVVKYCRSYISYRRPGKTTSA